MSKKIISIFLGLIFIFSIYPTFLFAADLFTRDLKLGDTGADVKMLQMLLNLNPATRVATSGAGSPGQETEYFGLLTKSAVERFSLTYNGQTGSGEFSGTLRTQINTMMGGVPQPTVEAPVINVSQPVVGASSLNLDTALRDIPDLPTLSAVLKNQNFSKYGELVDTFNGLEGKITDFSGKYEKVSDLVNDFSKIGSVDDFNKTLKSFKDIGGNFEKLTSGYGDLKGVIDQFKGGSQLKDLSKVFDQFKNLEGNIDDLFSGFKDFKGVVDGLKEISDLKDIGNILEKFDSLGGNIDKLLEGTDFNKLLESFDDFKALGDLNKVFDQFKDLGNISEILKGYGNFSEMLDGLKDFKNLADFSKLLDNFKGLNGSISELMGSFGDMKGLLSGLSDFKQLSNLSGFLGNFKNMGGNLGQLLSNYGSLKDVFGSLGKLNLGNINSALSQALTKGMNVGSLLEAGALTDVFSKLSQTGSISSLVGGIVPAEGDIPFGGMQINFIQCTCTGDYALILVNPAKSDLPKTLMYSRMKAVTYPFAQIPKPGAYVLGLAGKDKVCQIHTGIGCIPVGFGKDVTMVGTSQ